MQMCGLHDTGAGVEYGLSRLSQSISVSPTNMRAERVDTPERSKAILILCQEHRRGPLYGEVLEAGVDLVQQLGHLVVRLRACDTHMPQLHVPGLESKARPYLHGLSSCENASTLDCRLHPGIAGPLMAQA